VLGETPGNGPEQELQQHARQMVHPYECPVGGAWVGLIA